MGMQRLIFWPSTPVEQLDIALSPEPCQWQEKDVPQRNTLFNN
jgi:hypothetical protein